MVRQGLCVHLLLTSAPARGDGGKRHPMAPLSMEQLQSHLETALLDPAGGQPVEQSTWLPGLNCTSTASQTTARDVIAASVHACRRLFRHRPCPSDNPGCWASCSMDLAVRRLEARCDRAWPGRRGHGAGPKRSDTFGKLNTSELLKRFEHHRLASLARSQVRRYRIGEPFPHAVFDDFLPAPWVDEIMRENPPLDVQQASRACALGNRLCKVYPEFSWLKWTMQMDTLIHETLAVENQMGPATKLLMGLMRSPSFLSFLQELTGKVGLLADPALWGGGIHQTASGGYLVLHKDFRNHPYYWGLIRVVNVFLYINGDWPEEEDYGGFLELWENSTVTGARCVKKIKVSGNRLVVFDMGARSWHGHPWPLRVPPDKNRRSIALYFYQLGNVGNLNPGAVLQVPCETQDDPRCYGEAQVV